LAISNRQLKHREFWIRIDERRKKARLHEYTCRHCIEAKTDKPTIKWTGPYASVREGLNALAKLDIEEGCWHDQCCKAKSYSVYVVRLSERAWNVPAIRKANPQRDFQLPCVYVGRTYSAPEERFKDHKAGIRCGKGYVRDYGVALMPDLFNSYDMCLTYDESVRFEVELAEELRDKGYGVWQH